MKTFTAAVVADVSAALQDMIGRTVDVDDLCEDISEFQNSNGFWMYGTEESADFLRKYRIDAGEMFDEVCECGDINPFANPESFLCIMYCIRSHEIVSSLPWVLAHEGETVRLTPSDALAIASELDAYLANADDADTLARAATGAPMATDDTQGNRNQGTRATTNNHHQNDDDCYRR